MKIHIIQHDSWVEPGEYAVWADRNGYEVSYTKCWKYESFPKSADADVLIILGGLQCPATTPDECDYFDAAAERQFIKMYIDAGKAVIGVCLGAQLIGEALGAEYEHSPEREIGPVYTRLTAEGRKDPFLKHMPDAFYAGAWHNDILLSFDYSKMNRQLSIFLDSMIDDYMKHKRMTISEIMQKMIAFSEGNIHDIDHFIRVWTYAKMIGELEGLESEMQYVLETAAITHDIACPLCRTKYGNTNGKYQEKEGIPLVREFLSDSGMAEEQIERIAFLVGHHHTFSDIDGLDYQILIEADYIANALENGYTEQSVKSFMEKVMKTKSGIRLLGDLFCL